MRYFLLTMWTLFTISAANYPVFEGASHLKELFIPADVHIGSIIYRLRASDSDHDYPLQFEATDYGSYVVRVENLPYNINSTYCEANVYLERVLMVGQVFKFRFTVRDTKGDTTTISVSIEVTNAPVDITTIFPHIPGIIILPENTKPGTELEYVIVRRNPEYKKPVNLELRGSSVVEFGRTRSSQDTTTGVITLKQSLDFEQQNMYKLQVFALDMFTEKPVDSRNIAGFEIILIVEDVQDSPPVFIRSEPTIKLRSNLTEGDIITQVTAVDGDRGNPRQLKYGLVSENNPFTIFFSINRKTGQITLAKPLKQLTAIARSHEPILLTILAEEERSSMKEPPSMSTTATVALLLAEAGNTPPYFDNDHYVCHLDENSPQGTALVFSDAYSTQVHDDDLGKQGVFSLVLEQNNGTFEISPSVVERKAYFTIRVRNKQLLDYESRQSAHFVIVARELDPGSLSCSVTVLVYINDANDNPPRFQRTAYMAQIPENATANTNLIEVKATDIDTGIAGSVHYTRILGFRNSSLLLNSITGMIAIATDNHGFDREESSEYKMTVEARDEEGAGLLATVPIIIRVLDVNDETPVFENTPFHFILTADLKNFSSRAVIKATDRDADPPNNIVRYEITSGNYDNKFILNPETGELTVRNFELINNNIRKRRQAPNSQRTSSNVYTLTVRAYDLGVPHRWSSTQVRVFPPDTGTRTLSFLMPAKELDDEQIKELLSKLTGGHVTIMNTRPYHPNRNRRAVNDVTRKNSEENNEKKNQISDSVQKTDFHNKGVQANNRLEAQSSTDSNRHRRSWKFYHRQEREPQPLILIPKNVSPMYRNTSMNEEVPAFIYRSDAPAVDRRADLYIQDIPDSEYRILDPSKLNVQRLNEPSSAEIRQLGNRRKAHGEKRRNATPAKREETFIREGDAEILRLQTNEERTTEENLLNQPDKMYEGENGTVASKIHFVKRSAEIPTTPSQLYNQKLHLKTLQEKEREMNTNIWINSERNGAAEHENETNTLITRSGNNEYDMTKKQNANHFVVDFPMNLNIADVHSHNIATKPTPNNRKPINNEYLRKQNESTNLHDSQQVLNAKTDDENDSIKNILDLSSLEEERNKLTLFQRDILLTRFLVEEQRKLLTQTGDTQSLPGSLSMGTQTDRHRSTQTDVLCLMRPEPRKVKSENDDSSDSDVDSLHKSGAENRKYYFIGKDKTRHRIRSPIIEESESTEVIRSQSINFLNRDNRTSLLRLANSRNKINSRDTLINDVLESKIERKSNPEFKFSKDKAFRSTNDVHDIPTNNENVRVYLHNTKKSISYTNINDASFVLSDKEIYTPPSLKSRMITRRLYGSEVPKVTIHYTSRRQQDIKDKQKFGEKDSVHNVNHRQQHTKEKQKLDNKDSVLNAGRQQEDIKEKPKPDSEDLAFNTSRLQEDIKEKPKLENKDFVHYTSRRQQDIKDKQKFDEKDSVHNANHRQQDTKEKQKLDNKDYVLNAGRQQEDIKEKPKPDGEDLAFNTSRQQEDIKEKPKLDDKDFIHYTSHQQQDIKDIQKLADKDSVHYTSHQQQDIKEEQKLDNKDSVHNMSSQQQNIKEKLKPSNKDFILNTSHQKQDIKDIQKLVNKDSIHYTSHPQQDIREKSIPNSKDSVLSTNYRKQDINDTQKLADKDPVHYTSQQQQNIKEKPNPNSKDSVLSTNHRKQDIKDTQKLADKDSIYHTSHQQQDIKEKQKLDNKDTIHNTNYPQQDIKDITRKLDDEDFIRYTSHRQQDIKEIQKLNNKDTIHNASHPQQDIKDITRKLDDEDFIRYTSDRQQDIKEIQKLNDKDTIHNTSHPQQDIKDSTRKLEDEDFVLDTSRRQQDMKEKHKLDDKDSTGIAEARKKSEETWNKKLEKNKTEVELNNEINNVKSEKNKPQNSDPNRESTGFDDYSDKIKFDENVDNAEDGLSEQVTSTGTLKLKGKNQQLMEKKSVFTIAYDDAATENIVPSSNGSVQDK